MSIEVRCSEPANLAVVMLAETAIVTGLCSGLGYLVGKGVGQVKPEWFARRQFMAMSAGAAPAFTLVAYLQRVCEDWATEDGAKLRRAAKISSFLLSYAKFAAAVVAARSLSTRLGYPTTWAQTGKFVALAVPSLLALALILVCCKSCLLMPAILTNRARNLRNERGSAT